MRRHIGVRIIGAVAQTQVSPFDKLRVNGVCIEILDFYLARAEPVEAQNLFRQQILYNKQ